MNDTHNKQGFPFQPHTPGDTRRSCTPWNKQEGRVISFVSRKGGVGKTTSAVNIGAALALSGHTVLVISTDPQCGVCRSLGFEQKNLATSLDDIFSSQTPLTELAQPSPLENLFFVSPRIDSLAAEESFMANMNKLADDFAREIDRARNLYDTILIDCPPSLGAPTRAALLASDSFLVPVQAEELCRTSLAPLMEFVTDFRQRHFPGAKTETPVLEGLFLTMVSSRTRMSRHVSAQVEEEFGSLLLDTTVPRTTRLCEMALKGKPAVIYARKSGGSRAYFNLADELVQRFTTQMDKEEAPPQVTSAQPQGMDRLLVELNRTDDLMTRPTDAAEPTRPEMVSLDDLLAEEEYGSEFHAVGDDQEWTFGIDPQDPQN